MVAGEHVGRLGHEVHAAEDDVGGRVVVRREPGQFERVTAGIGPLDDLVPLVVVAEDEQSFAKSRPRITNALVRLNVGQLTEAFR